MPLLAAEIPAKLNSSQLSRPTADVTVALEAISEIYVLKLPSALSPVRRRHICEPGLRYDTREKLRLNFHSLSGSELLEYGRK